ncbi:hypothetical protein Peur_054139 [Populus x canadensis]
MEVVVVVVVVVVKLLMVWRGSQELEKRPKSKYFLLSFSTSFLSFSSSSYIDNSNTPIIFFTTSKTSYFSQYFGLANAISASYLLRFIGIESLSRSKRKTKGLAGTS